MLVYFATFARYSQTVPHGRIKQRSATGSVSYRRSTDGLVGNNLDALDVASGLKNLTQHFFSYSGVQSSHVEGSLVRFGRGATRHIARPTTAGRHGVQARVARQGRSHGSRDGIRVLRDHDGGERRGRHVLLLLALMAIEARGAAGWRREITPGLLLVGHGSSERWRKRRGRVKYMCIGEAKSWAG